MNTSLHYALSGVGLGATGTQTAVTALSMAATGVQFVPVVGQIAGAILGIGAAITGLVGQGCGATCVETSTWANQAEILLRQNLQAWQSLPASQKTAANQQAALNNFDKVWQQLVMQCSASELGGAGQRCISDRQAGACTIKSNGACWNWFSGYRDPIANDPQVAANQALVTSSGSTTQGAVAQVPGTSSSNVVAGIDSSTLLLLGGAGLVLLLVMSQL